MYIRRTTVKSRDSGEPYCTYRLVESLRTAAGVRQRTLLNLGRHFDVPREHWGPLALRIEHLLGAQGEILGVELPTALEACAQRYAAQLLHARAGTTEGSVRTPDYHSVDVDTLEVLRPRSVGIEHVALSVVRQLELDRTLEAVGLNRKQVNLAIGTIVARMVMPASELASYEWLCQRSGLGELLETDFERYSLMSLYRIADQLLAHKEALEDALYTQERSLFDFTETITLYDLTNTYFEGLAQGNAKAARGHSKEKRSDCPLVTLALVLDGSGFPKRSEIFEGNVSEPKTLAQMLEKLSPEGGGPAATVVLDAGIASEENIAWLVAHGYPYLVVSRKRHREFDPQQAVVVKEQADQEVRIQRVVNPESVEVELYCHSSEREKKDRAIYDRFATRFEQALEKLRAGLSRKGTVKKYDKVLLRIGRLKQRYARAASHYEVSVQQDPETGYATDLQWRATDSPQGTHPGVYCLRTDQAQWNEKTLWETYTMLTDLEAVFRTLKSELGLRPIFHHKTERTSAHLFISVLAYHLVHTIRHQLKACGITLSWEGLRRQLDGQDRVTVSMRCPDGEQIFVRKSTRAEPRQSVIYHALGISSSPGITEKTVVPSQVGDKSSAITVA
jgi:transposase